MTDSVHTVKKKLASGIIRQYHYRVNSDGSRTRIGQSDISSLEDGLRPLYRNSERKRAVATVLAAESLLIVGEQGCGKSYLLDQIAQALELQSVPVATAGSDNPKKCLHEIAGQLGVDTLTIEGKQRTIEQMKTAIAEHLDKETSILLLDDVHRWGAPMRMWLEKIHAQGTPLLIFATHPQAKDIFLRLPRIELKAMNQKAIREIILETAEGLGLELNDGQIAALQERCGGNPMLAVRECKSLYLGTEDLAPDHTQWIDGSPFLIAALMCLVLVRFIGLGFNSTTLYLLGGALTVAVGVVRILFYSLPRNKGRLGA